MIISELTLTLLFCADRFRAYHVDVCWEAGGAISSHHRFVHHSPSAGARLSKCMRTLWWHIILSYCLYDLACTFSVSLVCDHEKAL